MKRFIETNKDNFIIDICNEPIKRKNCVIFLDEAESPADVWVNNKCIQDESGNFNFKYISGKIMEIDNSKSLLEYKYNSDLKECLSARKQAYLEESDGLFFDYQRGEVTEKIWTDKVKEIKLRYPKPIKK